MMQTEHIIILSVVSAALLAQVAILVIQAINMNRLKHTSNDQNDVKQKVDYMNNVLVKLQNDINTKFNPVI